MTTHNFDNSLINGKAGEWVMNKYHAKQYIVRAATMKEQYKGIDAIYTSKQTGTSHRVETKTDFKTVQTGNIAIEVVSNTSTNKPGWALTSQSDFVIYYIWDLWIVLYFKTNELKEEIGALRTLFETKPAHNKGYDSLNILVPLFHAQKLACFECAPVNAYWIKNNFKEWIG